MPNLSHAIRNGLAATLLLGPLCLSASAQELEPLQRGIDERPEDAKAYEAYATAAIQKGQFDDAASRLKLGIARIPDFARAYYLLGVAARSKAGTPAGTKWDWNDAAVFYRVYISLRPNETDPYFGLGKALVGMKESRAAIAAFNQYIALEKREDRQRFVQMAKDEVTRLSGGGGGGGSAPVATGGGGGSAAQLKAEADALKNAQKFDEAVTAYKKALEVDPNNPDLHNDLGNAYFGLKKYNDAAEAFKAATARDANYSIGWYNLANALRKADRKPEAVDAYKHYMQLNPTDSDPWFGMAQTLKSMGDTAAAGAAFRKYLEMEKRPEQQKWIDKAKAELAAIDAAAAPPPQQNPGGKVGFEGM